MILIPVSEAKNITKVREQLNWYGIQNEKEEIDERIETCMNFHI